MARIPSISFISSFSAAAYRAGLIFTEKSSRKFGTNGNGCMYGNSPSFYRHLRPGYGFIEQLEIDLEPRCDDGTLEPNSPLVNWYRYLIDATSRTSKPLAYQHNTRQLLEQAGFIDISETIIKVPYHHWPRDPQQAHMGDYYQLTMNQIMGLEALCMAPFSRVFEWTQAQIETFTGQVRHEIQSTRIHAYNNM